MASVQNSRYFFRVHPPTPPFTLCFPSCSLSVVIFPYGRPRRESRTFIRCNFYFNQALSEWAKRVTYTRFFWAQEQTGFSEQLLLTLLSLFCFLFQLDAFFFFIRNISTRNIPLRGWRLPVVVSFQKKKKKKTNNYLFDQVWGKLRNFRFLSLISWKSGLNF